MKLSKHNASRGFTLIELCIVVVIMTILLALGVALGYVSYLVFVL